MMAEDLDRARELVSESLRLAEELGLEATRARNLNTLGVGKVIQGDRGGLRDLEQAIAIAEAVNSYEEISARANLNSTTVTLGDLHRAAELHEEAREAAVRLEAISFVRWQLGEHVVHCYWEGRWDEALATAEEFLAEVTEGSSHYMESTCRSTRARVMLARGEVEAALAEASRGTELARSVKDPQSLYPALAFEARARLVVGDRAGAEALASELLVDWREVGARPPHEPADGAWAFRDLGRSEEFGQALARARLQTPWHRAAQLIVEGEVAAAADVYAEIGSVPDEAYARLRAAGELVRAGRRADADGQLRLALPVFASLGAGAWTAEGEALLAASA